MVYYIATSKIHGMGLFASEPIKAGDIIGYVKGRKTNKDGPHVLWLNEQQGIQVSCDLRYINHSSQPNAAYYDDRSVVALRDIGVDEEITHNYGDDWGLE